MKARDEVLRAFRDALPERPVEWASARTSLGDYDGRDATLEVFDVPSGERAALIRALRPVRERALELLGTSTRLVFHTPEATEAHYAWAREEFAARQLRAEIERQVKLATAAGSSLGPGPHDRDTLVHPDGLHRESDDQAA